MNSHSLNQPVAMGKRYLILDFKDVLLGF